MFVPREQQGDISYMKGLVGSYILSRVIQLKNNQWKKCWLGDSSLWSVLTLGLLAPGGTAFINVYILSPEFVESET